MTHANPYRAMAESGEPPFELEPYALMALDEDSESVPDTGVTSVLMRAEDFTRVHSSDDATPRWVAVTAVTLAFAGVMTLSALLAWIGESFL